jgi:hypothetical protein
MRRMRQSTAAWLLLWTVVFASGAALLLAWRSPPDATTTQRGFGLRVTERDGHLRLDWDPSSEAIRTADGARLEAVDGGRAASYPVDSRILRSGGLDYIPQTKDVLLTLTLLRDGAVHEQAAIRSMAPVEQQAAIVEPPQRRVSRRAPTRGRARRR